LNRNDAPLYARRALAKPAKASIYPVTDSKSIRFDRRTELLEFLARGRIGIGLFLLDELCAMNKFFRAPIRTFVAGLLAVLPVVLTVAVIVWVTSLVDQFVGPHSAVGKLLVSIGLTVVETRIAAYVIGIGIVFCAVYMLGLFVEAGVQRRLQVFIDSSLRRIPLVGSVYDLAHRFVGMFERKEQTDLKTMSPVWCFFGGEGGAAVLALLPTPEPILLGGHQCHVVLVPTAPVPFGGGLFFVPVEWIKPASFGVEGLTSIYVSMGISAPQHFSGSSEARSAGSSA
jgi:uncharacterized membrane protein